MIRGWFVTGTDTGVGKTRVSAGLLAALVDSGRRAVGMKPVASGCRMTAAGARNEDAETLLAASNVQAAYEDVNPYAFLPPTAPHLAAAAAGTTVRVEVLRAAFDRLCAGADAVVVEGVGGWQVPLADDLMLPDLARALGLPVILVVGVRLGAINHALLTEAAIAGAGLSCVGWVANRLDPDPLIDDYLPALHRLLRAPCLGELPHCAQPTREQLSGTLDLSRLAGVR